MTKVKHINPNKLHSNPTAFTNIVTVEGAHTTVYIGGQNCVTNEGKIIGKGDVVEQTRQTLQNLKTAIESVGGELKNIIKWTVYVVTGQKPEDNHASYREFLKLWGNENPPPLISMIYVSGLAHPDFLVEVDAIAII